MRVKEQLETAVCTAFILLVFVPAASTQQNVERSRRSRSSSVPASQVVQGNYFAFGPMAEISGTVDGDVYAFAGQVVVNGTVNGDLLVAGGRVSVSGAVAQDVRATGGHISVTGAVGRNLTVAAGNVELAPSAVVRRGLVALGSNVDVASPIDQSVKIAAGTAILSNRIGGDVDAAVETLRITSKAEIGGSVDYWSGREALISEGALIRGRITRRVPPETRELLPATFATLFAAWIFWLLISFVSTLILGLLSVRFLPRFHESAVTVLKQRPWESLGIGFVAVVVTPVVCAILFATVVAIPIALVLTAAYLILLYWGRIFAISRIGEAILARIRTSSSPGWAFVLGAIVYYLFALIPFVGWIVIRLVVLFGLGAELMAREEFYVSARSQELI
jgi:cytoskeletal protein CcmA (bactofilin family)